MENIRPRKIVGLGSGVGIAIPAQVCRDLNIYRGDYFNLIIQNENTMILRKMTVAEFGNFEQARDTSLPVVDIDKEIIQK